MECLVNRFTSPPTVLFWNAACVLVDLRGKQIKGDTRHPGAATRFEDKRTHEQMTSFVLETDTTNKDLDYSSLLCSAVDCVCVGGVC